MFVHRGQLPRTEDGSSTSLTSGSGRLGTRVAGVTPNKAFIASTSGVYAAVLTPAEVVKKYDYNGPSFPNEMKVDLTSVSYTAPHTAMSTDIQTIHFDKSEDDGLQGLLSVTDAAGAATIFRTTAEGDIDTSAAPYSLLPEMLGEEGWADTVIHPQDKTRAATLHRWTRSLSLFQGDRLVKTCYVSHHPSAIASCYCEAMSAPIILVAESGHISVWNWEGECINRTIVSRQPLLAVAASRTHIVVGGVERQVSCLDPRSWRPTSSWRSALKYEVSSIHLSSAYDHVAFVGSSTDAELAAGSWTMVSKNGKGSRLSSKTRIRGDTRWVGLSKVHGADHLFALTAGGYLYSVQNSFAGKFDAKAIEEAEAEANAPDAKRGNYDEEDD